MNDPGWRSLVVTRVALGTLLLFRTTPLANVHYSPLTRVSWPLLGWPQHGWHAAWLGLALQGVIVAAACILRTLLAVLFTAGIAPRITGVGTAALAFVVLSQDAFTFCFTFYVLFLGVLLVALADRRVPRASLRLIHFFVASIYAWSAIAKLRGSWIDGRTLGALHDGGFLRGPVADFLLGTSHRRIGAAWSVLLFELALGPLLLVRRTRLFGLIAAISLHFVFELTAKPDVFGLVMVALLCSFLPRPRV